MDPVIGNITYSSFKNQSYLFWIQKEIEFNMEYDFPRTNDSPNKELTTTLMAEYGPPNGTENLSRSKIITAPDILARSITAWDVPYADWFDL